ncbi:hypothetical protein BRC85_08960 [Halobacteriales archaeon QS_1_69_70]|nr:MAG: hypothetical protein BRC85_08960 [Halobacteriales archaeon QS_1_69_70]
MSERAPDDEDAGWEPTFPWERADRWLRTTETGRFVAFNALVFGLVGVAFALEPIATAAGGGQEVTRIRIGGRPPPPEIIALAFGSALAFTPMLAVVSGVIAGLFLRPSTGAKAITAAVGVAAGAGTLLLLFIGTLLLLGNDLGRPGLDVARPVLSAVGAILVGAGTAAVTDVFLPTQPNG